MEPLPLAAVRSGDVELLSMLLRARADVDERNELGDTALLLASELGKLEMVNELLDRGAKVDLWSYFGKTALSAANQQRHTLTMKRLLEEKADPNGTTAEGDVSRSALQSVLILCFLSGSVSGCGAIRATRRCQTAVEGARECQDAARKWQRALFLAISRVSDCKCRFVQLSLTWAAGEGHRAIVSSLLAARAVVDVTNKDKESALHWACKRNRTQVVNLLIAAKCSVNLRDHLGIVRRVICLSAYLMLRF